MGNSHQTKKLSNLGDKDYELKNSRREHEIYILKSKKFENILIDYIMNYKNAQLFGYTKEKLINLVKNWLLDIQTLQANYTVLLKSCRCYADFVKGYDKVIGFSNDTPTDEENEDCNVELCSIPPTPLKDRILLAHDKLKNITKNSTKDLYDHDLRCPHVNSFWFAVCSLDCYSLNRMFISEVPVEVRRSMNLVNKPSHVRTLLPIILNNINYFHHRYQSKLTKQSAPDYIKLIHEIMEKSDTSIENILSRLYQNPNEERDINSSFLFNPVFRKNVIADIGAESFFYRGRNLVDNNLSIGHRQLCGIINAIYCRNKKDEGEASRNAHNELVEIVLLLVTASHCMPYGTHEALEELMLLSGHETFERSNLRSEILAGMYPSVVDNTTVAGVSATPHVPATEYDKKTLEEKTLEQLRSIAENELKIKLHHNMTIKLKIIDKILEAQVKGLR